MKNRPGAVLITGCSTGIGRATAKRLAAAGHTVYATARNESSIEDLADLGCRTLALDVTDEASMKAAVDAVLAREGVVVTTGERIADWYAAQVPAPAWAGPGRA